MRSILPALLVALLVAGCISPSNSSQTSTTTAPAAAALPTDLKVPTVLPDLTLGKGAGEPNLAVAPDGTIYVTPIDHVYRSLDAGKTFSDLGTAKTDGHGDGDIAISTGGRLHWLGLFGSTGGKIPYQHSDDKGQTWSQAIDLSAPTFAKNGTGRDREWIDAHGDVVITTWRDTDGSTIKSRTSQDGGQTWGKLAKLGPDAVGGPVVHGPRPGSFYEAMTTFATNPVPSEGTGSAIQLARTYDNGTTWDAKTVVVPAQSVQDGLIGFPTSIFPVAGVDASGRIYVAFSADQRLLPQSVPKPASRLGIFLTSSADEGQTWTAPRLVSDSSKAAVMPFIAAGAAGRIAIVWYENTVGLPNDALPDAWNVQLWESIDAGSATPHAVVAKLNDLPNHIGSVCTSGTGCLAGGDRSLLDYFEVALDPAGQPVAAWASSVAGTAVGVAAQGTDIHFGGAASGTPLR